MYNSVHSSSHIFTKKGKLAMYIETSKTMAITSDDYNKLTVKMPDTIYWVTDASAPICRNKPIFIHKTNCPNCGGLLDGNEHNPYVKCACCGAKVWSEREVS